MNDNDYLYGIDPIKLKNMSPQEKAQLIALRKQNAGVVNAMGTDQAGDFDGEDMEPTQEEMFNKMQDEVLKEKLRKQQTREGYLMPGKDTPKESYKGVWSKIKGKLAR